MKIGLVFVLSVNQNQLKQLKFVHSFFKQKMKNTSAVSN